MRGGQFSAPLLRPLIGLLVVVFRFVLWIAGTVPVGVGAERAQIVVGIGHAILCELPRSRACLRAAERAVGATGRRGRPHARAAGGTVAALSGNADRLHRAPSRQRWRRQEGK